MSNEFGEVTCNGPASHPSNTPSHLMLQKPSLHEPLIGLGKKPNRLDFTPHDLVNSYNLFKVNFSVVFPYPVLRSANCDIFLFQRSIFTSTIEEFGSKTL
jgi:hypothetical protein